MIDARWTPQHEPRRIAVIRALYLGDMLLSVPAFRSLRQRFPGAEITLIGLPWAASFTERFRHLIDRFLPFPGYPGITEVPYDDQQSARFITEQREYRYDLVIQMHGSGQTSNPFAIALDGAVTAGYVIGTCPSELDLALDYPESLHEVDRNLRLIELVGGSAADRSLEFPISATERHEANDLAGRLSDRPLVTIHPGSKLPSRRWMPERFAAVADALIERCGAGVILTGGADEKAVVNTIASLMRHPAMTLAGQTSLGSLAAIIERSSLLIVNDTGPSHLAAALRTPSIVLFGPGDLVRWAPPDTRLHRVLRVPVPCSPCLHMVCPIDHRCLRAIEPERVFREAAELLAGATGPRAVLEMQASCAG